MNFFKQLTKDHVDTVYKFLKHKNMAKVTRAISKKSQVVTNEKTNDIALDDENRVFVDPINITKTVILHLKNLK